MLTLEHLTMLLINHCYATFARHSQPHGRSGSESRERALVVINPSFAPSWMRLFGAALHAGAFAWTFICRRF